MRYVFAFLFISLASLLRAEPPDRACTTTKWGAQECIRWAHFVHDTCQLIETVSTRHKLDTDFFTRLIWQESRFDPFAKSHANALALRNLSVPPLICEVCLTLLIPPTRLNIRRTIWQK